MKTPEIAKTQETPIREREQFFDPALGKWVKRHAITKEVLGIKARGAFARVPKISLV